MGERKKMIQAVAFLICILVGWVIYVSSKQLQRNQRIEEEVSALEQEAEKIRRENDTLSEKISYFASPDFREQEAKEKLGMKKIDESVIIIKSRPVSEEDMSFGKREERTIENGSLMGIPNYQKWWQVFFQKN